MATCVQQETERSADAPLSYSGLIRGRERVRSVLAPLLGDATALERANNIAQALVYCDIEPRGVAEEMLRGVPFDVRTDLARRVCDAWCANASSRDE